MCIQVYSDMYEKSEVMSIHMIQKEWLRLALLTTQVYQQNY